MGMCPNRVARRAYPSFDTIQARTRHIAATGWNFLQSDKSSVEVKILGNFFWTGSIGARPPTLPKNPGRGLKRGSSLWILLDVPVAARLKASGGDRGWRWEMRDGNTGRPSQVLAVNPATRPGSRWLVASRFAAGSEAQVREARRAHSGSSKNGVYFPRHAHKCSTLSFEQGRGPCPQTIVYGILTTCRPPERHRPRNAPVAAAP
jgi:hypothetical protein